jgi:general secretion pathway protein D
MPPAQPPAAANTPGGMVPASSVGASATLPPAPASMAPSELPSAPPIQITPLPQPEVTPLPQPASNHVPAAQAAFPNQK